MPLLGLLFGRNLAGAVGRLAPYFGGGLLVIIGGWTLAQSLRTANPASEDIGVLTPVQWSNFATLGATAFALSMDNLVVGFGLGVARTPILAAIVVFALVSLGLTFLGLELGRRLGLRIRMSSEVLSGSALILVGVLVATGVLSISGQ
jgi:putative Mn2+ efflux pump MntP